jgi:hypothetical protein
VTRPHLRIVTARLPATLGATEHGRAHSYRCGCAECRVTNTTAPVCQCDKPHVYSDDVTGEPRCLCGRQARPNLKAA